MTRQEWKFGVDELPTVPFKKSLAAAFAVWFLVMTLLLFGLVLGVIWLARQVLG